MSRRGSSLDVLCERPVVSRSRIRSHWSSRSFNTYTSLRHYIDVRNDFEIGSRLSRQSKDIARQSWISAPSRYAASIARP